MANISPRYLDKCMVGGQRIGWLNVKALTIADFKLLFRFYARMISLLFLNISFPLISFSHLRSRNLSPWLRSWYRYSKKRHVNRNKDALMIHVESYTVTRALKNCTDRSFRTHGYVYACLFDTSVVNRIDVFMERNLNSIFHLCRSILSAL